MQLSSVKAGIVIEIQFLCLSPSLAAGAECKGPLCLCERGERQPVCVSGRVRAGVYGDALTAVEASAGPDRLGHAPHHGLHLHLQRAHHPALGPGNLNSQPGSD